MADDDEGRGVGKTPEETRGPRMDRNLGILTLTLTQEWFFWQAIGWCARTLREVVARVLP